MNLIEQLEALLTINTVRVDNEPEYVKADDLRAIIEQAKREAVEPVAVPEGYKMVPIAPPDDMKRAYTDKYGFPSYGAGHEYRFMVREAPEAPQPDHTKLIGELVEALDVLRDFASTVGGSSSFWDEVWPKHDEDIDKAREAIK